jgi:tetratricopeptide (TPR) repeat protein
MTETRYVVPAGADDAALRAEALHGAACLADIRRDLPLAKACAEEALDIFESLGDLAGVARASLDLGNTALDEGDYERTQELYEQAKAAALKAGDDREVASALNNLGDLALQKGNYKKALTLLREAVELKTKLGYQTALPHSLHGIALACFQLRRHEESAATLKESLKLVHELRDRYAVAVCLSLASSIAVARGRWDQAARLLAMADALKAESGSPSFPPAEQQLYEETAALLREQLDPTELETTSAASRRTPVDEAVGFALQSLS